MPDSIDLLFSTPMMSATFSPEAHMRGMLAFEAALARLEARAGIIPQDAAAVIAANCQVELFNVAALEDAQVRAILSPEDIDRALDPTMYLGSTDVFINRALEAYREAQSSRSVPGGGV